MVSKPRQRPEVRDKNSAPSGATASKADGEVQEKPAAARVGVEDADCQRGSEARVSRSESLAERGAELPEERSDIWQRRYPGTTVRE